VYSVAQQKPAANLKLFSASPIQQGMANNKKTKTVIPSLSFNLKDKPHQVSEITLHYGSLEDQKKDRVLKMTFSVEVEDVPKAVSHIKCTYPLHSCFEMLKKQGHAPMVAYMEKVLDDIGDVEMKEVEMLRVLSEEGFQFDAFIEGVIFSVDFYFENVQLEEGEEWEGKAATS
jgi:hypothetical protein